MVKGCPSQRTSLQVPLPKIPNSPFCPSTALLHFPVDSPFCNRPIPLFHYYWLGASNVPLTCSEFVYKLKQCLSIIGLDTTKYLGHSFRRVGATLALQYGLPVYLIKIQSDWRSNACEGYLEPSFDLRKQVANTNGSSVQSFSVE